MAREFEASTGVVDRRARDELGVRVAGRHLGRRGTCECGA
jgi:hypothetical protein